MSVNASTNSTPPDGSLFDSLDGLQIELGRLGRFIGLLGHLFETSAEFRADDLSAIEDVLHGYHSRASAFCEGALGAYRAMPKNDGLDGWRAEVQAGPVAREVSQ